MNRCPDRLFQTETLRSSIASIIVGRVLAETSRGTGETYGTHQTTICPVHCSVLGCLICRRSGFVLGLLNAPMVRNEKVFYFTVLMYGLFSAVSLQKSVRDRLEGLPVTGISAGFRCYLRWCFWRPPFGTRRCRPARRATTPWRLPSAFSLRSWSKRTSGTWPQPKLPRDLSRADLFH